MSGYWTGIDGGAFIARNLSESENSSGRFGFEPGKILAGYNAPDTPIVDTLPEGTWVFAEELALELFGDAIYLPNRGKQVGGKYLHRLYALAKSGYLESVVLRPPFECSCENSEFKRYYRIPDIEKLKAEVSVRFLTKRYK